MPVTNIPQVSSSNETIGVIKPFGGPNAPVGYLFCAGQAVSRTTYAALFAIIGTTYGVGDGSTTFNLPDLRGRTVVGKDDMGGAAANRITSGGSGITGTTLGATGGAETHTLTTAQLAAHNHGVTDPGHSHEQVVGAFTGGPGARQDYVADQTVQPFPQGLNTFGSTTGISIQNNGSGSAHNNTQPSMIVHYIIAYQ